MIHLSTLLKHYKRREIQEEIVAAAGDKEVAVKYGDKGFGKRPDVLNHPKDVLEFAKNGATSFHCSEELWHNPLQLDTSMRKQDLDELRKGWDLVLDIDCPWLEYSQIAAELLVHALQYHGVEHFGVKFSVSADTPILVKEKQRIQLTSIKKAIDAVKAGKPIRVLSLDKQGSLVFSEVYDHLEHEDQLYELFHSQSGIPLKVTAHHSVFVWDNFQIVPKRVQDLKAGDCVISFHSSKRLKRKIPHVNNTYTLRGERYQKKFRVTKELLRLIGYYLAEGHLSEVNNQIGFSFHTKETNYLADCQRLIKKLPGFTSALSRRSPSVNATQIICYSKEWYSFFNEYCGKGAKNKHIPDFCWTLPKDHVAELLRGYIRGDGHVDSDRYITVKSVSTRLASEMVWLCKLNGISCNLYSEQSAPHKLPQGNLFKGSFVFMLKIPRREIPLNEFSKMRKRYAKLSQDKLYPTDGLRFVYHELRPKKFLKHKHEQMALKKRFANQEMIQRICAWLKETASVTETPLTTAIIKRYLKLINSDACFLPIRKIRKIHKSTVYDISVKRAENFFGNFYPILLHNSGNHGFHIAVPFEALPERVHGQETRLLFPDGPRKIATYLQEMIRPHLASRMLEHESIAQIMAKTKKTKDELQKKGQFDPFSMLAIDTVLISSRHLYRMPYSFNEKSGLVSIPLSSKKIPAFDRSWAVAERVSVEHEFLPRKHIQPGEASKLLVQAFDYHPPHVEQPKSLKQREDFAIPLAAVPEQYFPPCIRNINKGLQDGKKRAVFVLINFLSSLGWNHEQIETWLKEWNKRNPEPLREQLIVGHVRYHQQQKKKALPPNCANKAYMVGMGVCVPDTMCGAATAPGAQDFAPRIKNPVNYALKKQRLMNLTNKPNKPFRVKQGNTKPAENECPQKPSSVK